MELPHPRANRREAFERRAASFEVIKPDKPCRILEQSDTRDTRNRIRRALAVAFASDNIRRSFGSRFIRRRSRSGVDSVQCAGQGCRSILSKQVRIGREVKKDILIDQEPNQEAPLPWLNSPREHLESSIPKIDRLEGIQPARKPLARSASVLAIVTER